MSRDTERKAEGVLGGVGNYAPNPQKREAVLRSIGWCFASDANTRFRCGISNAGVAHTLSVALLELTSMARGKGKQVAGSGSGSMPRFVDVALTGDEKAAFKATDWDDESNLRFLSDLVDSGYRVGVAWSGEHQAYTVSMTCRDPESPNAGLCVTSFARTLGMAVALAEFKHKVVTEGVWSEPGSSSGQDFG